MGSTRLCVIVRARAAARRERLEHLDAIDVAPHVVRLHVRNGRPTDPIGEKENGPTRRENGINPRKKTMMEIVNL